VPAYPGCPGKEIVNCGSETAKHRITQTVPHNSSGTLVSGAKDLCKTQMGSPLTEVPNTDGVG